MIKAATKFKNPRAKYDFQGRTCSITGVGSYLPEKILTNADLEKMVDTSDEWITSRTGIKERRLKAVFDCGLERPQHVRVIWGRGRGGGFAKPSECARAAHRGHGGRWRKSGLALYARRREPLPGHSGVGGFPVSLLAHGRQGGLHKRGSRHGNTVAGTHS